MHPPPCCSCPSTPCPPHLQVQAKLKLVGIEAIYLASSGERITRLDQLQDIDELYVVEVRGGPAQLAEGVPHAGQPRPAEEFSHDGAVVQLPVALPWALWVAHA